MSVDNIEDHIAMACECGSVNFSLLKSNNVECNSCGSVKDIVWKYTKEQVDSQ